MKNIYLILFIPLALIVYIFSSDKYIHGDILIWKKESLEKLGGKVNSLFKVCLLLSSNRIFRSIFYHRLKCMNTSLNIFSRILSIFYWKERLLVIYTRDIGPGLFAQHGIVTGIAAKKIGKNFMINHMTTIGYTDNFSAPTIGDNVRVYAGAIILGDIHIGDNAIISAGSVVVKDVEANTTVGGVPAKVIKRNG